MPKANKTTLRASSKSRRDFSLLRRVLLVFPDVAEGRTADATFETESSGSELIHVRDLQAAALVLAGGPVSVVVGSARVGGARLVDLLDDSLDVPLVVIVDEGDETEGVSSVASGALDWVVRSDSLMEALPHIALGAAREWREFGLRRAAEEQLRHADRLALVGRLAAALVHEVGTPLNVVRMRAQLLALDESHVIEATNVIVEQCDRITEMLERTLDFARRGSQPKHPTDLFAIASRANALLSPALHRSHVVAEVDGEHALVLADHNQLLQVVLNLLTNAMDAMVDGGRIAVGVREEGGLAYLRVTDCGLGIAPENMPHLFAPFFTTKDPGRGTGLGLAVCADIAEQHGGRITVSSLHGQGTSFTLELPTLRASEG